MGKTCTYYETKDDEDLCSFINEHHIHNDDIISLVIECGTRKLYYYKLTSDKEIENEIKPINRETGN